MIGDMHQFIHLYETQNRAINIEKCQKDSVCVHICEMQDKDEKKTKHEENTENPTKG